MNPLNSLLANIKFKTTEIKRIKIQTRVSQKQKEIRAIAKYFMYKGDY